MLLNDQGAAREIGAKGREMVARAFPISVFATLARRHRGSRRSAPAGPGQTFRATRPVGLGRPQRLNILMQYVSSPFTTARYFHEAAGQHHTVATVGLLFDDSLLKTWGFTAGAARLSKAGCAARHALDLRRNPGEAATGVQAEPAYFYVDSGHSCPPARLDALRVPKICYEIDTHVNADVRIREAQTLMRSLSPRKRNWASSRTPESPTCIGCHWPVRPGFTTRATRAERRCRPCRQCGRRSFGAAATDAVLHP